MEKRKRLSRLLADRPEGKGGIKILKERKAIEGIVGYD